MVRILYVTTVSNTMNAFLIPHIKMLINEGHDVNIACSTQQQLDSFYEKNNVLTYDVSFDRNPISKKNYLAYKKFKRLLKKENFDIIHTHTPIASMIVRFACRKKNIKVFYTAHGFHFYKGAPFLNWLVYFPIEFWLSRYTDKLITINREDYQLAERYFKRSSNYFCHGVGIDLKEFDDTVFFDVKEKKESLDISMNSKVFLSIGELNSNKNHSLVIESLSKFKDYDFVYLICGVGNKQNYLEKIIKENGLEKKVRLLGYRTDISELTKITDFFFFLSFREGLPVSVMEALAAGIPVIASKIRGNVDLLSGGNVGTLIDLNDNPKQSLEAVITNIFFKPEVFQIKSGLGKKEILKYSIDQVLEELKIIYQD